MGREGLAFVPATFIRRNARGKRIAVARLRTDDFPMGVGKERPEGAKITSHLKKAVDIGEINGGSRRQRHILR